MDMEVRICKSGDFIVILPFSFHCMTVLAYSQSISYSYKKNYKNKPSLLIYLYIYILMNIKHICIYMFTSRTVTM